ncbi:MAG: homogentisate 1,2-dioxygenase [Alphaproteobacteria bacterium]|nr:homogentisate 1,2-dioxygenase [Alphaproteobacteria bacterium]MDE2337208.1 homogentisate 1,2-dioxygenase [Alphaproteobacteria bacterium]
MVRAYQSGFGNTFETEALKGALPREQNSPQQPPHGLYAEQLSGSAFTVPHKNQQRTWLYRILPSVKHLPFRFCQKADETPSPATPNQLRWDPLPAPKKETDLIDGVVTMAKGGDLHGWAGLAAHRYALNAPMKSRYFYNADGEMLFVPEQGGMVFRTEMGVLEVKPGEICVIPRGIKFAADPTGKTARGYICENYGASFTLPDLGPIGSNGLAHPRHFLYPAAAYEDQKGDFEMIAKFDGALWSAKIDHSPLDVVAWHGNYAPYKYDLALFNTMNTVSFDHADPSIFTVLTSQSGTAGVANVDFVIFPPRWSVAEHTFRPPYFHRNVMSEFMGLVHGVYDAKESGGFAPGGCSLHNCMSAHGPDAGVVKHAAAVDLKPMQMKDTLAFMFESRFVMRPTASAMTATLQKDYYKCWQSLQKMFKGKK